MLGAAGAAGALELAAVAGRDGADSEAARLPTEAQAVRDALAALGEPGDKREAARLKALRGFYEARDFEPIWFRDGAPRPKALALASRMARAKADGLDPRDYARPGLADAVFESPADVAATDVALSFAALSYASHLFAGRVAPASVSPSLTHRPADPDAGEVLGSLSAADDPSAALQAFEPPHPEYRALRARLAVLLRAKPQARSLPVVPEGPLLRPGEWSPRVPALRARLQVEADPLDDPEFYDEALADAVRAAQAKAGLKADGVVGPRTLLALNGASREAEMAALVANMERWRWMPRDLGRFHVLVNVPEFVVRVREDGETVHRARVVVGTPKNPTPIFSDEMDHLVVNPYWNVPNSILTNEMLPEIQADPAGYFAERGYQVLAELEGKTYLVDPVMLDWTSVDPRVRIRQVPGVGNALGQIKFMFPNEHDVYVHDTPLKQLFERDARAFSHGCVRVDDPLAFADALLADEPEWTAERIAALFGGKERRIDLSRAIPVHLAYFTLNVGDDGRLRRFADVYGFDRKLAEAIGFQRRAGE
jgi:murein L,D-transpeptidase YcbB/YkuD